MSRQEDLPRAASPLKRRAGSAPPEDEPDATDVDMLALPPTANSEDVSIADGDIIEGVEVSLQGADADSPGDDGSTSAQVDDRDRDEDTPDINLNLTNLDMDRSSVYETHVESDNEDNAPTAHNPGGGGAAEGDQQEESKQEQVQERGNREFKTQEVQNDSSATNTDEAADSDAKTADTVGTNTSVEDSAKNISILGPKCDFGASKYKGNQSSRNSSAPPPYSTRGRQQKSDRKGLTGLSNLGNTCYMNSALQCIRSVEELTKYFVTGEFEEELNYDNPLGHGGQIANAYAYLLKSIYKRFSSPNSVSPRAFKDTVGRYAPQFSGWAQQDTQEFLGFLLDGLQEDLNRVKKKPYIEKPDSTDEMVGNQELIRELAAKVWDIHKKRDDSVIGDLFTGLYKSTLVCPTCAKISITFEPFTNLTLPLPIRNMWQRRVRYFPLNDRPVDIMVELDKSQSIRAVKEFISSRVGVPADRLIGAEEFDYRFYRIYEDYEEASVAMENKNDKPCFFELEAKPSNLGKKKKPYKTVHLSNQDGLPSPDDPVAEQMSQKMLVPVMHRINPRPTESTKTYSTKNDSKIGFDSVAPPHFIILTPTEAHNEDAIRRKILEKVVTFTSRPDASAISSAAGHHPVESSDVDPTLISASDADSSGDGRIVAKSIEGEDDLVDVSMQDAPDKSCAEQDADEYPYLLKKFNTRRPDWINPEVHLDKDLQELFDMSTFAENSLLVTGWSSYGSNHTKLFPRLATRIPQPQPSTPSDDEMPSPSGSGTASEESSTEETPEVASAIDGGVTRMAAESSDEESLPDLQNLPPRVEPKLRGGRKQNKYKTYGKRGRAGKLHKHQQTNRHLSPKLSNNFNPSLDDEPAEGSRADGGPLVRLGEGIVVDWDSAAWGRVFGLDADSNDRTSASYSTFLTDRIETLKDGKLEAAQMARRARTKVGISLDDCLDEFEKEEILSEEDKWYCPKCKEFCRAAKKFDLWHTPDILIVHLKRFSSAGHRRDKIDAVVEFPIEGLDISTRVIEQKDGKQEVYDLIAIDDHMGGLGGGHYTAFAKNFEDDNWYKFDDSIVSGPIRDTKRMITSHAYLLFYRRRSDGPLGGLKLEEACLKYATLFEPADDDDEVVQNSEGTESR